MGAAFEGLWLYALLVVLGLLGAVVLRPRSNTSALLVLAIAVGGLLLIVLLSNS